MRCEDWNDCENFNYEKFAKKDEGLAYTIAMEMYHARKAQETHDEEKRRIVAAIDQIADGICELEQILGISIQDMQKRHMLAKIKLLNEKETEAADGE